MRKVLLRTILTSLLGIITALVLVWGIISLAVPRVFVEPAHKMGLNKVSAWYATNSYIRTKDMNDLYTAVLYSAEGKNDEEVIRYGTIMINRDGFAEYCKEQEETDKLLNYKSTKQYIFSCIAISYYNLGEDATAVKTALKDLGEEFDKNNAVTDLLYKVLSDTSDRGRGLKTAKLILSNLESEEISSRYSESEEFAAYISEFKEKIGETE